MRTFIMTVPRIGLLAVGLLSLVPAPAFAQTPGELSLLFGLPTIAPPYPVSNRGIASHIVYAGEPLIVQITLVNESNASIRANRPGGWLSSLRIEFEGVPAEPSPRRAVAFDLVSIMNRSVPGASSADPTLVSAGEIQEARLQLRADQLPGVGTYEVRATLDPAALSSVPSWPRAQFTEILFLGVLSVDAPADEWNVLFARGVKARLEGRPREARDTLGQLITRHPESAIAWVEIGRAWVAENNCGQAIAAFQRARGLIDKAADPSERTARMG